MINPDHLAMLAASGITADYAAKRGYETINDKRRLAQIKIVRDARGCVPGLLVPMLRVDGSTWGWQYRPDAPRIRDGKPVKYETPWGQENHLDIPPGVGPMLGDPNIPLFITEGSKKADCGVLHGLCVVALPGVWNFRGTNNLGGKVAIADWQDIALNNGRRVILAYDGDLARKDSVQKAAHTLGAYLAHKGAKIEYLWLPDTPDKTGLDDYLMGGHTVADLWSLVKPTQPPVAQKQPQQPPPAPKPAPAPFGSIDGAALLDDVDAYLKDYVVYPSEHMRHAHALWAAHTHLMDCWESTPRIAFLSPEPSSGKTRALEVTEPLVPRPVHSINTTSAYLFRKVSDPAGLPTILYDEIDTVFGPKAKENEEIRGIINAGHRNGAVAGRCVTKGDKIVTEELPAYCAVAIAGLDDLPDTIMTRSVIVRMKPRARTETVKPWRLRTDMPIGRKLGERLAAWADSVRAHVKTCYPDIPAGVEDRDADIWEALLAVADAAGGHWKDTARVAAVEAVEDTKRKVPTMGLLLLADIRKIFDARLETSPNSYLLTKTVVTDLQGVEESPWATIKRDGKGIDARGLATRLSRYSISSADIKVGGFGLKGYYRRDFEDTWKRYLDPPPPPSPDLSSTASTPSSTAGDPSTNGQPTGQLCTACGRHELIRPESIARGTCAECAAMFRGNPKSNRKATP